MEVTVDTRSNLLYYYHVVIFKTDYFSSHNSRTIEVKIFIKKNTAGGPITTIPVNLIKFE